MGGPENKERASAAKTQNGWKRGCGAIKRG